jgi:hypothetical protein
MYDEDDGLFPLFLFAAIIALVVMLALKLIR